MKVSRPSRHLVWSPPLHVRPRIKDLHRPWIKYPPMLHRSTTIQRSMWISSKRFRPTLVQSWEKSFIHRIPPMGQRTTQFAVRFPSTPLRSRFLRERSLVFPRSLVARLSRSSSNTNLPARLLNRSRLDTFRVALLPGSFWALHVRFLPCAYLICVLGVFRYTKSNINGESQHSLLPLGSHYFFAVSSSFSPHAHLLFSSCSPPGLRKEGFVQRTGHFASHWSKMSDGFA